jgi:hypothetical protein
LPELQRGGAATVAAWMMRALVLRDLLLLEERLLKLNFLEGEYAITQNIGFLLS